MMIKLYKKNKDVIEYWEIWDRQDNPLGLIIHWGQLGNNGEAVEVFGQDENDTKAIYDNKVSEKRSEGYEEPDFMFQMVLQFHTDDTWGDTNDLDFRNETWDYLNEVLGWSGNGRIHGGDIGSGKINLFFDVVNADIAVQSITDTLHANNIEKRFIIACRSLPYSDDNFNIKVIYPQNYPFEFSY